MNDNLLTQNSAGLTDVEYLRIATEIAKQNVLSGKGRPFGAVIVTPEGRIFGAGNSVTTTNDPTAHAEVNAIRHACEKLGTFDLSDCLLYSSCEPCPMCLGAGLWSRVSRIVFAADRNDAAAAGFDDAAFYDKLAKGEVAEQLVFDHYREPFKTWAAYTERIEY